MNNNRKIKISKIENKMLKIGCEISIIESLSKILTENMFEKSNLKMQDITNLSLVLKRKIIELRKEFNIIEVILKI